MGVRHEFCMILEFPEEDTKSAIQLFLLEYVKYFDDYYMLNYFYQDIDNPNKFVFYDDCIKLSSIEDERNYIIKWCNKNNTLYETNSVTTEFFDDEYHTNLPDDRYDNRSLFVDISISGVPETNNVRLFDFATGKQSCSEF